ncbi:hypothetical protein GCK72_011323 [Caenorhabditis remanei]|uniref:Uncharacterized protein n=1 Tax=Caenorhabditis remanei TaxID=31234 RepID=A0A6A5H5P5_CAERE|nr:hypothetical protein GCK72_011323 [Caenorhabditis remanei]KAF1763058.1 hypothetical protein GCK72_011323 [Caenorhabditis remanei]
MRDLARNRDAAPATKSESTENSAVPPNTSAGHQTGTHTAVPTSLYLDSTVVQILLKGLEILAKYPPENPIEVLADFLLLHKDIYNAENQNRDEHSMDHFFSPHCNEAMMSEGEIFAAKIQAAWYPRGQGIREKTELCLDLLIQFFKNDAVPFIMRNAIKKMEEKRRHRDHRNELFGLPNTWKDQDFLYDFADVTRLSYL